MATRKYDKLTIEEFGTHLLHSNDLDPIYLALARLLTVEKGWGNAQVYRWMVAYWCLYHAGAACHLSNIPGPEFWAELEAAAANSTAAPTGGRWPRGHERRHFRGQQGVKAVQELAQRYKNPTDVVAELTKLRVDGPVPFAQVSEYVRSWRGFGPWIAFKVGDMMERVLRIPVSFEHAEVFMFDAPKEAAILLWRAKTLTPDSARPKNEEVVIKEVVNYLLAYFEGVRYMAPPHFDRPLGLQEVETILCKWKSHMNGAYPLWNDIDEIHNGLEEWAQVCPAAAEFKRWVPTREGSFSSASQGGGGS